MENTKVSKNEIEEAKSFMESKHLHYSDYWLISCLKWIKEEFSDITDYDRVHENIYQQWLLTDLRDLKICTLPPLLKNKKKMILNGLFAVQVMYVIDVSRSMFSQIQEIRNKNSLTLTYQTDEEKHFSELNENRNNRYLKIILTDGVQEIDAFEFKRLPQIHLSIKPGCKVYLKGPIDIRKGLLLLEEKNLKILGGHVESLLISNHYENVLAKFLKLPINKNVLKEKIIETNEQKHNDNNNKNTNELSYSFLDDDFSLSNFEIDDDVDFNKYLENIDKKVDQNNSKQSNSDNDFVLNENISDKVQTISSAMNIDDDIFAEIDIDKHLDSIEEKLVIPPVKRKASLDDNKNPQKTKIVQRTRSRVECSSKPYNYIKQILERSHPISGQTIRVYARFKSVFRPITINRRLWSMSFSIMDFTGEIVVEIASNVIEDLIGYSPEEIIDLKKRMAESNAILELITQAFEKCEKRMMQKFYLMNLHFINDKDNPTLTYLNDFSEDDYNCLEKRIKFALDQLQ